MSQSQPITLFWFQNLSREPIPAWIARTYTIIIVKPTTFPELADGLIVVDCDLASLTTLSTVCQRYTLPVLALTYAIDVPAALDAGAWDYIIKEQITPALLDRIIRYADNHQHAEIRSNALSRALSNAEMRFHSLLQKHPDGIVVVDSTGNIDYANPAAEKLFNRAPDQLIGNPLGFPILAGEMTEIEIVSHTGHPNIVEMRNNDVEWYGQQAHLLLLRDITPRRAAEEQNRYLAGLIEGVSDAIISVDNDLNIRSWNRGAETVYGWSQAEVFGRSISSIVRTVFEGTDRKSTLEELRRNGYWQGEVTQMRKDDTPIRILASTTLIKDEHGVQIGLVSINQDITERKRLQEAIFQTRLRQVELEKERELVDLKANFISMVSHEFRTPLSVIFSASELLERYWERLDKEDRLMRIHRIQEQTLHMTAMINNVLLVGKANAGKIVAKRSPLQLRLYCHKLIEEVQVAARVTHHIVFDYHVPTETVSLDATLLQHILLNLLSNAVKYSPGKDSVHFQVLVEENWLVFRVTDYGIGIPEAARSRLFEPFFRANNSADIQGTGLGLVIVKNNVEAHGGTIEVESQPHVGTSFTVRIPMYDTEHVSDPDQ